ncbi:hypothetical protein COSO111634_10390 [Corallococcus soli]
MTPHQLREGALQGGEVQHAAQSHGGGDVVERVARLEFVEEPQALLRERQRQGLLARGERQRAGGIPRGRGELRCQLGQRGSAQQHMQRERHAQARLHLVRQLHRPQRIHAVAGERLIALNLPRGDVQSAGQPDPQPLLHGLRRRRPRLGGGRVRRAGGSRLAHVGLLFAPGGHLLQLTRQEGRAARPSLDLAAGRLGQAAGGDEGERVQPQLMRRGHLLADGARDLLHRHGLLARVRLVHQHQPLFSLHLHGEGRATPRPHRGAGMLRRQLDVLGVVVATADDDEVLDAAGDEELRALEEALVAGAQEGPVAVGGARVEVARGVLGAAPVAQGHARALHPHLTHLTGRARDERLRLHHAHVLVLERAPAAHQRLPLRPGLRGLHPALAQPLDVQRLLHGERAALAAGDDEGAFGQAVAGVEGLAAEAAGREGLGEALQRLRADGLGAAEGHVPVTQVERRTVGLGRLAHAQVEREVGPAADGAVGAGEHLQPAQGTAQEGERRQEAGGEATVEGAQDAADEPHVMVRRQPDDAGAARVHAERTVDELQVVQQVGVREHHALGRARGA